MHALFVSLLTLFFTVAIEATATHGVYDCQVQGTSAENATSGFLLNEHNGGFIVSRLADGIIAEVDITPETYLQTWSFVPSQGPHYDLVTEIYGQTLYLGVDAQGLLRMFDCSSNGSQLVPYSCRSCVTSCSNYATTIWKPACDGTMKAEVNGQTVTLYFSAPNVAQYTFNKEKPLRTVLLLPIFIPIKPFTLKNTQTSNQVTDLVDFIKDVTTLPKNEPLRCPAGMKPVQSANGAANGCGTDTGIGRFVPDLIFEKCCNNHDYCWSDCTKGFSDCNIEFGRCLQRRCIDFILPKCSLKKCNLIDFFVDVIQAAVLRKVFPQYFPFCHGAALIYQFAVSTKKGAQNFHNANSGSCSCMNPTTTKPPTCNSQNYAASSILGLSPMDTGTIMGMPIGSGPTPLAKSCMKCCESWANSLKGKTGCCILQSQYNRPNNTCAPQEFVKKCCCVSLCPCEAS